MQQLTEAFGIAVKMIFTGDPEVYSIAFRTLWISLTSTLIASVIFVPFGCLIQFSKFRGKNFLTSLIMAFYSIPTVFVGMLVFLLASRSGPLGGSNILFTPLAIIIGEVILIAPIITGLTISALENVNTGLRRTILGLGVSRSRMLVKVLSEVRFAVITAVLMGYGRAVSEIGIALMVGGNIAGSTRTLTTAIALDVSRGETAVPIALGLILLSLALLVSVTAGLLRREGRKNA